LIILQTAPIVSDFPGRLTRSLEGRASGAVGAPDGAAFEEASGIANAPDM